jgi:hypothetical protein
MDLLCFKSPFDYFRSSSCIHFIISILLLFFWVTNSNSNYKQVMTHESMSICNTQEKPEKNITQTKPLFFLLALQPHTIKEINFKTTPLK